MGRGGHYGPAHDLLQSVERAVKNFEKQVDGEIEIKPMLTNDEKLDILEAEHESLSRQRDELTYRLELIEEQIHELQKEATNQTLK